MVLFAMVVTPGTTEAKNITIGIDAGYFAPIDSNFTGIYGSGEATFGVNAAYFPFKFLSVQAAYDMWTARGDSPIPGIEFSVNLKTLRIGGFFHLNLKRFFPKAGGGLVMTTVEGESPFGFINDTKSGWFVGTGVDIRVYKNFLTGLELLYHDVTLSGNFGSVSVGGISLFLTLKLEI